MPPWVYVPLVAAGVLAWVAIGPVLMCLLFTDPRELLRLIRGLIAKESVHG